MGDNDTIGACRQLISLHPYSIFYYSTRTCNILRFDFEREVCYWARPVNEWNELFNSELCQHVNWMKSTWPALGELTGATSWAVAKSLALLCILPDSASYSFSTSRIWRLFKLCFYWSSTPSLWRAFQSNFCKRTSPQCPKGCLPRALWWTQ